MSASTNEPVKTKHRLTEILEKGSKYTGNRFFWRAAQIPEDQKADRCQSIIFSLEVSESPAPESIGPFSYLDGVDRANLSLFEAKNSDLFEGPNWDALSADFSHCVNGVRSQVKKGKGVPEDGTLPELGSASHSMVTVTASWKSENERRLPTELEKSGGQEYDVRTRPQAWFQISARDGTDVAGIGSIAADKRPSRAVTETPR